MKVFFASLFASATLLMATLAPAGAGADDSKPLSQSDVEAIVKKVIQDNPDLIFQTLYDYQQKTAADRMSRATQNLVKQQDKINHDPHSPSIGNPNGDVTLVEFFDYHCGYCKRFFPEIPKLLQDDKNVRIVFKEFPILSADSAVAARAALAVYSIDPKKYFDYHIELMNSNGKFTEDMLTDAAKHIGIDPDAFKKAFDNPDILKYIENNKKLADAIGVEATPAIVIGTELLPGAVPYDDLVAKVQEVRDSQKQRGVQQKKEEN
jgi:protein-disulfide isomerase